MDKDRVEGSAKEIKGKAKEVAGKVKEKGLREFSLAGWMDRMRASLQLCTIVTS